MTETKTPQAVKYYEDGFSMQQIDQGLEATARILQGIVNAWHELTDKPVTMAMIADQFIRIDGGMRWPQPENIVRVLQVIQAEKSRLYNEVDLDKLIAMLPAPPDISRLVAAVSELQGYLPSPGFRDRFYRDCFTIKGRQVVRVEAEVAKVKSQYCVYATTEGELSRLALVNGVIERLDEIRKYYPDVNPDAMTITGLITTGADGRLMPSTIFVERAIVPGGRPTSIGFYDNAKDAEAFKSPAPTGSGRITAEGEVATAQVIAEKRNNLNR